MFQMENLISKSILSYVYTLHHHIIMHVHFVFETELHQSYFDEGSDLDYVFSNLELSNTFTFNQNLSK